MSKRQIQQFEDEIQRLNNCVSQLRETAQTNARHAEAARATARVAITHLQALLTLYGTEEETHRARRVAREWLLSIGG